MTKRLLIVHARDVRSGGVAGATDPEIEGVEGDGSIRTTSADQGCSAVRADTLRR